MSWELRDAKKEIISKHPPGGPKKNIKINWEKLYSSQNKICGSWVSMEIN